MLNFLVFKPKYPLEHIIYIICYVWKKSGKVPKENTTPLEFEKFFLLHFDNRLLPTLHICITSKPLTVSFTLTMYMQLTMKRIRGTLLHIMVTKEIADELKTIAKRQGRTVTELAREAFAGISKQSTKSKVLKI